MNKATLLMGTLAVAAVGAGQFACNKENEGKQSSKEQEVHRPRPEDPSHRQSGAGKAANSPPPERTAMDGKIILLEGEVGPQGSTGPVTVKRADGATISSSKLEINEDGTGLLQPPVEIHLPNGLIAVMDEKGMLVTKEGGYKTLGRFKVTQPPTNVQLKGD